MGIDTRHFCRTIYGRDDDYHRELAAEHVALIRAVIADEAAKAAPAASPQRAEGVPEWFRRVSACLYNSGWQTGRGVNSIDDEAATRQAWSEVQAEIARRVADKDALIVAQNKHIAELEANLERAQQQCNSLPTITLERDAARAEVERLKKTVRKQRRAIQELQDQCDEEVERFEIAHQDATDSDKELDEKNQRIADLESRVAEQCKEIERLSRPCDGRQSPECNCYVAKRERNVREAAEASLAELREFVKMWRVTPGGGFALHRSCCIDDHGLDANLAAFRKHKEPAK